MQAAMDQWFDPSEGVEYGYIVAAQSCGCVACVVLWLAQYLASLTREGEEVPDVLFWAKDCGYWMTLLPFFPSIILYGVPWRRQVALRKARGLKETSKEESKKSK